MNIRRLVAAGAASAAVLAGSACLQPNQHTLVGISAVGGGRTPIDTITFTFDQGAPGDSTARYVNQPPAGPSGQPVGVDGTVFVRVDLTPAVAHDVRGASTAPAAYYPRGAVNIVSPANVVEVAKYEDSEGHVGYTIGLRRPGTPPLAAGPTVRVTRTADEVVVTVSAY